MCSSDLIKAADISRIEVAVNPLAIKLCGNPTPRDGLEAKLSIAHSVAVTLADGAAGVVQYRDTRVTDPAIMALRDKVILNADAAIGKEQARVRIALHGGTSHELFVKHARGSNGRPLSDAELEAKFRELADGVLLPPQTGTALEICRALESITDAGELARAATG